MQFITVLSFLGCETSKRFDLLWFLQF